MDDSIGAPYPFEAVYFTTESETTGYGSNGKQNEEPGYHTKRDCRMAPHVRIHTTRRAIQCSNKRLMVDYIRSCMTSN